MYKNVCSDFCSLGEKNNKSDLYSAGLTELLSDLYIESGNDISSVKDEMLSFGYKFIYSYESIQKCRRALALRSNKELDLVFGCLINKSDISYLLFEKNEGVLTPNEIYQIHYPSGTLLTSSEILINNIKYESYICVKPNVNLSNKEIAINKLLLKLAQIKVKIFIHGCVNTPDNYQKLALISLLSAEKRIENKISKLGFEDKS